MSSRKYQRTIIKKLKQHDVEVVNLEKNKHLKFICIYKGKKKIIVFASSPGNGCWEKGIDWNLRKVLKENK